MKKYLKIALFLIIIIVIILVLLSFVGKDKKITYCYDEFSFDDIYLEIDLATSGLFTLIDNSKASDYLPLDFSDISDYLMAVSTDDSEEYFVIMKNLSEEQIEYLNTYVEARKSVYSEKFSNVHVNTHNTITYIAFSDEYSSTIEGIIRSFIYCD